MQEKQQFQLMMLKPKKHSWKTILILIALGFALVVAALIYRGKAPAQHSQLADQARNISAHSSAQAKQVDNQESIPSQTPPETNATQEIAPKLPTERGLGTSAPTKIVKGIPQDGTFESPPPSLQIAETQEGGDYGIAPIRGKYYCLDSDPVFDPNVKATQIAAATATPYIVVSGDILGTIAKKFDCSIDEIRRANNIRGDHIVLGQKLLIPQCGNPNALPLIEAQNAENDVPRGKWWKRSSVDTKTLPKLMREEGFKQPQQFMAFVLEITFDPSRKYITRERAFDWNGSSSKKDGWNPASTIKLFAAIAALKRLDELGFSSKARLTFHSKKEYKVSVSELIQSAIIESDNIAYNRVAQLAGFDYLHTKILSAKYGIPNTALNRGYELSRWQNMGENPSLRIAPAITITEGSKTTKLPAANTKLPTPCSASACTTLQDLAESSRRLMLQEQLPSDESYDLKQNDLIMLRRAMRSERTRGNEMVNIFSSVFKDERVKFYSKPGFSEDWFTDNVYIFDPRHNQAWIVVMSGYPGRNSLNSAAKAIANLINKGALRKIP